MTTKVVRIIKQATLFLLFIGILSCETDTDGVGVDIVDNGIFETETYSSDVVAYNQNVLKRKANKLGQYLLGVYKNDDFGKLDATILGQIGFQSEIDFGVDPSIDSVILNIPYHATRQEQDFDNGSPKFVLDSIIGDQDVEYNLNIYELETYLNALDPSDPSKELDYYTDESYTYKPTALYSGMFKPKEQDTVLYIERREIIIDEATQKHDRDTIKNINATPFIKIPLDEDFFTNNFINNPSVFESVDVFVDFFRGLYIEASVASNPEASVISLDMTKATMSIYYTNTETSVRTKQVAEFQFFGVTNNIYTRDYTGSKAEPIINNPNTTVGDERLYLQGAAGSIGLIDLFTNDDIEELRSNNWLINEANLIFYVDQSADASITPDRLFLYNYDKDTQISDAITEGSAIFGGRLELDDNDNPYRYKFNITDYISRVLDATDPIDVSKLAVKVLNVSDVPSSTSIIKVEDYSWNPKGIIVHGNQSSDTDKKIKLEIVYSTIN